MTPIFLFLKGILVGGAIAVPVGPIGVLCLHRALAGRATLGLASGLGAAMADAIYGAVAAFGLTSVSDILIHHQDWFRLFGGFLLLWLGFATWRRPAATESERNGETLSVSRSFFSAMVLTLSNPITVFAFAVAFGGLGLIGAAETRGWVAPSIVVLGVFSGAAAWWVAITVVGHRIGRRTLGPVTLRRINQVSGVLLIGFGLVALAAAANAFFGPDLIPGLGLETGLAEAVVDAVRA